MCFLLLVNHRKFTDVHFIIGNIDHVDNFLDEINKLNETMKRMQESVSVPSDAAADFDEVSILTLCLILVMLLIAGWVDLKPPSGNSMLISDHFAIPG